MFRGPGQPPCLKPGPENLGLQSGSTESRPTILAAAASGDPSISPQKQSVDPRHTAGTLAGLILV